MDHNIYSGSGIGKIDKDTLFQGLVEDNGNRFPYKEKYSKYFNLLQISP